MRDVRNKLRLVAEIDLLREFTNEDNPVSITDIVHKMKELDIPCDRRTVPGDIKMLRENGYQIGDVKKGREHLFYYCGHDFSCGELSVLIDAVRAAAFIPSEETALLIEKIKSLNADAEIPYENPVCFDVRKHSNDEIMRNVAAVSDAIHRSRQITFRYFDLTLRHYRKYRKEKRIYCENPLALVYNEDNYYVVCWSSKYHDIVKYRVDRMDGLEVSYERIDPEALEHKKDIAHITEREFKMYSGETKKVTLRFSEELIGTVYDRFGEKIKMKKVGGGLCETTVEVAVSPVFYGWLLGLSGDMAVVAPDDTARDFISFVNGKLRSVRAVRKYKNEAGKQDDDR